jgi:hypothetical protein
MNHNNQDQLIENWSPSDMIEVLLKEPDDFLRIKETLTRIGVSSKKEKNILYQSCHILHKQGRYFIVHFKELFMLDGKLSNFTENDRDRRNTIVTLLSDWGLLEIVDLHRVESRASIKQIKILPFKEKDNWILEAKYTIGIVKGNK